MGKKTKTLQATRPRLTSSMKRSVQGVLCFRPCSSWYDGFAASIQHPKHNNFSNHIYKIYFPEVSFKQRKREKLTHMALIHNSDPASSESAKDDSTFWWANDIVSFPREQDNNADNKHRQTEKVGSPESHLFLHRRCCD